MLRGRSGGKAAPWEGSAAAGRGERVLVLLRREGAPASRAESRVGRAGGSRGLQSRPRRGQMGNRKITVRCVISGNCG